MCMCVKRRFRLSLAVYVQSGYSVCSSELHHYSSGNTGGALLGVILLSYEHGGDEGVGLQIEKG